MLRRMTENCGKNYRLEVAHLKGISPQMADVKALKFLDYGTNAVVHSWCNR